MIISAVADPLAFERGCFDTPGYRQQAELFLRGISINGLLLVDPDARLQQRMISSIQGLPAKHGQFLSIRLEELLKNKRARIIRSHRESGVASTADPLELAWSLFQTCEADTLVSSDNGIAQLRSSGRNHPGIVQLSNYSESSIEDERNRYLAGLQPIDTLDYKIVEGLFLRVVKYARWLRFYDKQIGKGKNTSNFRQGIEFILDLWQRNGHFASRGDVEFVEIITCQKERISPSESPHAQTAKQEINRQAYDKVVESLLRPLVNRFPCRIKLKVKSEGNVSFHARHLQAQSAIILVDGGFDLFVPGTFPRQFKRNILKIDNGSFTHLQEYRRLPDGQF